MPAESREPQPKTPPLESLRGYPLSAALESLYACEAQELGAATFEAFILDQYWDAPGWHDSAPYRAFGS